MFRKLLCVFFFLSLGQLGYAEITDNSDKKNYYETLEISANATQEEIREAYRKGIKKWHPDLNKGNETEANRQTKRIVEAYDILKDPNKRYDYDSKGHENFTESSQTQESIFKTKSVFKTNFRGVFERTQKEAMSFTTPQKKAMHLFFELSIFQKSLDQFMKEDREYRDLLNKEKEKQLSASDREKLHEYKRALQNDLRVFRRVIESLGVPASSQHPVLLEMYFEGAKQEWMQNQLNKSAVALATEVKSSSKGQSSMTQETAFHEQRLQTALHNVKEHLDMMTYENLKNQANPIKWQSIKSFPVQFAMFTFAMGASIYAHSSYQKNISLGTEINTGELPDTMNHLLTPFGIFNFYVFVAISQQVHYRLYGVGKWMDGKSFKSHTFTGKSLRALSPSVGLGTGFFISSVLTELWQDQSLRACVKSSFKSQDTEALSIQDIFRIQSGTQDHISSCEQFALNWKASEKWKIYAVDIASLIGASILSHKIINSVLFAIRYTLPGGQLATFLLKNVGSRVLGYMGFAVNFIAFLEVHKLLDKWLGKPLKKQFVSRGVGKSLSDLKSRLSKIIDSRNVDPDLWIEKPEFLTKPDYSQETYYYPQERTPFFELKERIKETGYRFQHWTGIANQDYQFSYRLWAQSIQNKMMNYEISLGFLTEILNNSPSDNSFVSFGRKLEWDDIFSTYIFTSPEDIETYKEQYCERIDSVFEEPENEEEVVSIWRNLCDNNIFYVGQLNEAQAIYDTAILVNSYLDSIDMTLNETLKYQDYISFNSDELFSSDPQFSVESLKYEKTKTSDKSLNYQKWFVLARQWIQAGLDIDNALSGLSEEFVSQLKTQKAIQEDWDPVIFLNPENHKSEIHEFCSNYALMMAESTTGDDLEDQNEDYYSDCDNYFNNGIFLEEMNYKVSIDIALKYLMSGFYLLRQIAQTDDFQEFFGQDINLRNQAIAVMDKISPLLDIVEIHKKGEKLFLNQTLASESTKSFTVDSSLLGDTLKDTTVGHLPYIIQALLCGSHEPKPNNFNVNHFFESENKNIQVYDFETEGYQTLDKHCQTSTSLWMDKKEMQNFLFNSSSQYQGNRYENLYLVLHQILSTRYIPEDFYSQEYSSLQELIEAKSLPLKVAYNKFSKQELARVSDSIFASLGILQDNYYNKAITVDSEVSADSPLQDFLNYYTQDNIGWNWCELADAATFNSLRCDRHKSFKEIELAIFQVNYWLENLKALLENGKQGNYRSTDEKAADEDEKCRSLTLNQKGLCGGNYECECGRVQINFDIEAFETMQTQVLSCLQAQHDYFKPNSRLTKEDIKNYCFVDIKGIDYFKNKIEKSLLPSIGLSKEDTENYCSTGSWSDFNYDRVIQLSSEDQKNIEKYCSIVNEEVMNSGALTV